MYKLCDHDTLTLKILACSLLYVSDKITQNIYILKNTDRLSKYYFSFIFKSYKIILWYILTISYIVKLLFNKVSRGTKKIVL